MQRQQRRRQTHHMRPSGSAESLLHSLRRGLEVCWDMPEGSADHHHPASTWRYEIIRHLGRAANDPDVYVADWLQHGAPMGISQVIQPGGFSRRRTYQPL